MATVSVLAVSLTVAACSPASTPESAVPVSVDSRVWTTYSDVDEDSPVVAYQLGDGFIWVRFDGGSAYLYTDVSAGTSDILTMQRLAAAGDGLGAFIRTHVRYDYAEKVSA